MSDYTKEILKILIEKGPTRFNEEGEFGQHVNYLRRKGFIYPVGRYSVGITPEGRDFYYNQYSKNEEPNKISPVAKPFVKENRNSIFSKNWFYSLYKNRLTRIISITSGIILFILAVIGGINDFYDL